MFFVCCGKFSLLHAIWFFISFSLPKSIALARVKATNNIAVYFCRQIEVKNQRRALQADVVLLKLYLI